VQQSELLWHSSPVFEHAHPWAVQELLQHAPLDAHGLPEVAQHTPEVPPPQVVQGTPPQQSLAEEQLFPGGRQHWPPMHAPSAHCEPPVHAPPSGTPHCPLAHGRALQQSPEEVQAKLRGAQQTPPEQLGYESPNGPWYGVQQSASPLHVCCTPRQHSPLTHAKLLQQSPLPWHSSPPLEHAHAPLVQVFPQQSLPWVHAPPDGRQHCERIPKNPLVQGRPLQQSVSVLHAPPPDEHAQALALHWPLQHPASTPHAAPRTWPQHLPSTHAPPQHSCELLHAAPVSRQQRWRSCSSSTSVQGRPPQQSGSARQVCPSGSQQAPAVQEVPQHS
jgi:hypothetical protein